LNTQFHKKNLNIQQINGMKRHEVSDRNRKGCLVRDWIAVKERKVRDFERGLFLGFGNWDLR
jgi:hypothetical protein